MKSKILGLVAAPHTPFRPDGELNLNLIPAQAEWLAKNGVAGAFIGGTTGEWSSLTTAERLALTKRWVAVAPKKLKVIVHAGHNCLAEAKEIAADAQAKGAYAVAAMAPDYFRPATLDILIDFLAGIAAAAPKLPFYYYHMPAMNGVNFAVIDFLKAAQGRIPNLAGIKFTHENLMDYRQCVAFENGRYDVLFGRDEILLAALSLGATGAVGSTYNFGMPIYKRVLAAFKKGDLAAAEKAQTQAIEMIAVLSRYGGLAAGKTAMKLFGLDCGAVRLPLKSMSAEAEAKFLAEMKPLLK